jgi:uncharacterized phage-associated protein
MKIAIKRMMMKREKEGKEKMTKMRVMKLTY